MERQFDSFLISDDKKLLQPERIGVEHNGAFAARMTERQQCPAGCAHRHDPSLAIP